MATIRAAMKVSPAGARLPRRALVAPRPISRGSRVIVKAEEGGDFDSFLNGMADKFEKAENKTAIIGYSAAALGAFVFAEWFIHLPGLNVLLGFPVQLVGLLTLPYLVVRYALDKKDYAADAEKVLGDITSKLPGLGKQ